jgi:hypothetical protein
MIVAVVGNFHTRPLILSSPTSQRLPLLLLLLGLLKHSQSSIFISIFAFQIYETIFVYDKFFEFFLIFFVEVFGTGPDDV